MTSRPFELVNRLMSAALDDRPAARRMLDAPPKLLRAGTAMLDETPPHSLAVEGFTGADVDATNACGSTPLLEVAMPGNADVATVQGWRPEEAAGRERVLEVPRPHGDREP